MNYRGAKSLKKCDQVPARLAKISFYIYIFFIFFGTSLPFQERIIDADSIATSNPFSQIVFSFLYILSFISLLSKRHLIIPFIKSDKFLFLFLLWTFLSVFWSADLFVSFKRWLQIFGGVLILLSALMHFESAEEALTSIKTILIIYIVLSYFSILFISGAIQWEFPAWRGLAPHKNMLGQVSLISLIIWSYYLGRSKPRERPLISVFWILSLILLIGSKSFTSLLTGFILTVLIGIFSFEKLILRKLIGKAYSFLFIFSFLLSAVLIFYLTSDYLSSIFGFFGKDLTLTGRIDLWARIFEDTKKHLIWGSGFGGYWVVGGPFMDTLFDEFIWLPNQAHLGYLDILNETGMIGFSIFILMAIFFFLDLAKVGKAHFSKWFVITALVLNISESTLFRTNVLTGVFFIFSYLALYTVHLQSPLPTSHTDTV